MGVQILRSHSMGLDYYAILELPRSAQLRQIHAAYRRLALKLHPDKNKEGKSQEEQFVRVAEAYEVLRSEESRAVFDQFGEEGLKMVFQKLTEGGLTGSLFTVTQNEFSETFLALRILLLIFKCQIIKRVLSEAKSRTRQSSANFTVV